MNQRYKITTSKFTGPLINRFRGNIEFYYSQKALGRLNPSLYLVKPHTPIKTYNIVEKKWSDPTIGAEGLSDFPYDVRGPICLNDPVEIPIPPKDNKQDSLGAPPKKKSRKEEDQQGKGVENEAAEEAAEEAFEGLTVKQAAEAEKAVKQAVEDLERAMTHPLLPKTFSIGEGEREGQSDEEQSVSPKKEEKTAKKRFKLKIK